MTALTWGGASAGMPLAGPAARSSSSGCTWPMSCASARARRAWRSKRTASPGTSNWMASRVAHREKAQAVAARPHHAFRQAHHFINVLAQLELLAERQAERTVGNHLEVRLAQRASGHQRNPRAPVLGPRQSLHHHAQGPPAMFALNGVRDEPPRPGHAGHGAGAVFEVGRHAGDFGERSARAALHHPEVRADFVHQQRGLPNQPAIDAAHAHDNHQQQANADGREREPSEVVANVFGGEVHP